MPATQVKVEFRAEVGDWVDVSGWCLLPPGITIQRGRDSETGDAVPVGTCSLTLDNNDGRFSPELPSSPYYPYVVEGVELRVWAWANGAWRPRFYGRVQVWSVGWRADDEGGRLSVCRVTANDSLGSLPSYTFRQAADEVVRSASGVLYHWPLRGSDELMPAAVGDVPLTGNGGSATGDGGLLPMDEGSAQHPLVKAASGGLGYSAAGLAGGFVPWRLRLVLMAAPTANCTVVSFGGRSGPGAVTWSTSTGFTAVTPTGVPTSFPVVLELGTNPANPSFLQLRYCAADGVVTSATQTLGYIHTCPSRVTINPVLSGNAEWTPAHLMLMAGASDAAELAAFAAKLLGPRLTTDGPNVLTGFARGPAITGIPTGLGTSLPLLEGRDAAEALAALVTGMGARLVDNLDGTLTWVPFAPSTTPVSLPAGVVDPSLTWQTDSSAWLSDVTVTWPDGTSYTATRPDGKRQSGSIEGVHATRDEDRSYADWLVWSPTRARLPQAPFDLSTLTEAQRETLAGVKVGDRVTLTDLPTQMPTPQICIVEGIEETLTHTDWDLTLKLSPDVYSRLFILDDPVQGVLDSSYILAP